MNPLFRFLDQRPVVVALAGPNGAGKSTFYESFLSASGLRFINADELALSLGIPAYDAAELSGALRKVLIAQRESFIFETVLSDPIGEKVEQLASYSELGYTVALVFIRLDNSDESIRRLPHVLVYDNQNLSNPYQLVEVYEHVALFGEYKVLSEYQFAIEVKAKRALHLTAASLPPPLLAITTQPLTRPCPAQPSNLV